MKVHETRSQAHAPSDEGRMMTRKQKAESKSQEGEQSPKKKAKNGNDSDRTNGKAEDAIAKEYEEFCNAIKEHISVDQMRQILETNDQDSSGSDGVVITKW